MNTLQINTLTSQVDDLAGILLEPHLLTCAYCDFDCGGIDGHDVTGHTQLATQIDSDTQIILDRLEAIKDFLQTKVADSSYSHEWFTQRIHELELMQANWSLAHPLHTQISEYNKQIEGRSS